MSRQRRLASAAAVVRLLVATTTLCALFSEAKPVLVGQANQLPLVEQMDPMMALPSAQKQQVIYVEQQQPQEVHYVYSNGQQATSESSEPSRETVTVTEQQYAQQAAAATGQPDQSGGQSVQYVAHEPEAPYQLIQVQPELQAQADQQRQGGSSCNKRHELTSSPPTGTVGEARGDYPGEILYIGQSGDLLGQRASGRASDGAGQLSDVASSLAQNSGMPATILTEIPINEMPPHVLEKLKREYGVKIVATRERPGANLVINCEDYSNQDNSICQRQQQQPQQLTPLEHHSQAHQVGPHGYSLEEHQPRQRRQHRFHIVHQEQPQLGSQEEEHRNSQDSAAAAVAEAVARSQGAGSFQEPQPATNYSAEAPETRPVEEAHYEAQPNAHHSSAAVGEENNNNENYGTRTTVSADEQPEPMRPPPSTQQAAVTQSESTPGHQSDGSNGGETSIMVSPENDPRHAGFDEQPTGPELQEHSKQPTDETSYN